MKRRGQEKVEHLQGRTVIVHEHFKEPSHTGVSEWIDAAMAGGNPLFPIR